MRSRYEPAPSEKIDLSQISSRTLYEGITVHYRDGWEAEKNFMALKQELGERFEVNWPGEEYLWLRDVQNVASLVLLGTGLLTVIAGSISVFNTLQASILRKIREIGILRALGVTQTEVFLIYILQSALIGTIAAVVGLILVVGTVPAINAAVKVHWKLQMEKYNIESILTLPPLAVAVIFSAVVLICVGASLYPSWRASKVTPMDALRATA
jgi:ABC-type lipoprotein release transport system permease subunit